VVIWLNGTFGAGKTTTATALLGLVDGFRVFDPETVGYMLQPNLVDLPVSDFQHWAAWRPLVVATAHALIDQTGEDLIAPQTVLDEGYMAEILAGFARGGTAVFHVLLDCRLDVLRQRIVASPEATEWRLAHLEAYEAARPWILSAAHLVVDTTTATPHEVAEAISTAARPARR
jgi:cytidylate kinase